MLQSMRVPGPFQTLRDLKSAEGFNLCKQVAVSHSSVTWHSKAKNSFLLPLYPTPAPKLEAGQKRKA